MSSRLVHGQGVPLPLNKAPQRVWLAVPPVAESSEGEEGPQRRCKLRFVKPRAGQRPDPSRRAPVFSLPRPVPRQPLAPEETLGCVFLANRPPGLRGRARLGVPAAALRYQPLSISRAAPGWDLQAASGARPGTSSPSSGCPVSLAGSPQPGQRSPAPCNAGWCEATAASSFRTASGCHRAARLRGDGSAPRTQLPR